MWNYWFFLFCFAALLICHIIPLSQSTTSLRGSRASLLSPTKQNFSWVEDGEEDEEEEEYEEEEEEEVESSPSWFLEDRIEYLFECPSSSIQGRKWEEIKKQDIEKKYKK